MQEEYWRWEYTLSEILDKNLIGSNGLVQRLSPIFRDTDTIDPAPNVRYVTHYTANPRLFYQANESDFAPTFFNGQQIIPPDRQQRKIGSVRRSSDAFVIWDG